MSAPSFSAFPPPPLPIGWTEHIGPGGVHYYYNAQSQQSTYVRPMPSFSTPSAAEQQPAKKKKEKPLVKTPIPGTDWLRVTTTEGNVFYSHKVKKESVWTVPEEIKHVVENMQRQEAERAEEERKQTERERSAELERIKNEVNDLVKRKADDSAVAGESVISKKAKLDSSKHEDNDIESDVSDEEEWHQEAAEQLEKEAREEKQRLEEEERLKMKEEEEAAKAQAAPALNMPEKVNLSIEEAKALFKTLLREKDINPLLPWDTSLPQFVSDPRYVLLSTVAARKEAFDEYCRDRARELRQAAVKREKEATDPKEEYERLLRDEVKSTRTSWTDFRRSWKKDRRFYGWGRDDREREKKFREFIKELGEKKRAAAQQAEADFFALLRERAVIKEDSTWKEVKKNLIDDPRYDAVGSSSLREELYNTFLKGKTSAQAYVASDDKGKKSTPDAQLSRQERKERAVKEREEKIRAEKERLETNIERSRMGINREEGEREFRTLLVDAIRDHKVTWDAVVQQLKKDFRFTNSPLSVNQQVQLFHAHVAHLRSKHINNMHALFTAHSPSLATRFSELPLDSLLSSLPATKLGYDQNALENEFNKWQRERTSEARKAFDEMLSENSFVEFWGRLGKIGGGSVEDGLKVDNEDIGEEEGEGVTKVDMKALAKNIDIQEMEKVLKNDKRYIMFDHIPEQRELWLRDYLSNLSAPKLSVHLPPATS